MAIKHRIGKLRFTEPFAAFLPAQMAINDIDLLEITMEHAIAVASLPIHHRDPFDRLLIVQAMAANLAVVSCDAVLDKYGAQRIW